MSNNGAGKGSRQNKRPTPLRMVRPEEVRQYRPPVIIHTYSPKVIHVDAAHFQTMVQSLTGRPGLKRKPEASPKMVEGLSFAAASTSGNSDSSSAMTGHDKGFPGYAMSPRSPLPSFDHLKFQQGGFDTSTTALPQVWGNDQATNMFTSHQGIPVVSPGPQYSPLFSNSFSGGRSFSHLFSPLPSPNLLSPNFMADLPALSPSTYQSYDAFGSQSFMCPSPGVSRFANSVSQFLSNRKTH